MVGQLKYLLLLFLTACFIGVYLLSVQIINTYYVAKFQTLTLSLLSTPGDILAILKKDPTYNYLTSNDVGGEDLEYVLDALAKYQPQLVDLQTVPHIITETDCETALSKPYAEWQKIEDNLGELSQVNSRNLERKLAIAKTCEQLLMDISAFFSFPLTQAFTDICQQPLALHSQGAVADLPVAFNFPSETSAAQLAELSLPQNPDPNVIISDEDKSRQNEKILLLKRRALDLRLIQEELANNLLEASKNINLLQTQKSQVIAALSRGALVCLARRYERKLAKEPGASLYAVLQRPRLHDLPTINSKEFRQIWESLKK
ncbi:MAG: hypothetical protein IT292_00625 [Deltaproteobacteria bacterium]|nr:hypothetical protein [Deltaproteobacteria bacterium]